MSDDPLKAMLMAGDVSAPPAQDFAFTLEVMKRVERRRLMEGLGWLALAFVALTALLALVMPYLTPAVLAFGQSLWPAVVLVIAVGVLLAGLDQARVFFRPN